MTKQKHLFAVKADLEAGIRHAESGMTLKYVLAGMSDSPDFHVYESLFDYEQLGANTYGDHIRGDCFLVLHKSEKVNAEKVPQRRGGAKYVVYQDKNPHSITFQPGGIYDPNHLVCGHIATISESMVSLELFKNFSRAILKDFKKVGNYYVGPEALKMLDRGVRLITMGIDEPPEYDLKR